MTREQILEANKAGLNGYDWSYWTPSLQIAFNLGAKGVDLSTAPVVKGWRKGKAPETFVSRNYRDDISEPGLSLMALDGQPAHWSDAFISDRKVYQYTGILSGTGSDDEPCILAFEAECLD
jgi:hypothetical protein